MSFRTLIVTVGIVVVLSAGFAPGQDADGPGKLEYRGAEKRLEDFEAKVKRMRGQPFKLTHLEEEALRRIWELKEQFPDNADVEALYQRARSCVMASEGKTMQITPDMLIYRENEKKLKKMFFDVAEKEWTAYMEKIKASDQLLDRAWPPPDHQEVDIEALKGKYVILDDFQYPMNEFSDMGRQMVFVGSGARGYYFVELSNRNWLGAYEAFKRYKRFVNRDIPEYEPWTLVGRITGLELIVPQAGEEKTMTAHWGWSVKPEAIWVDGCTFSYVDGEKELGGQFAGEENMEKIKSAMYTVTEIPENATPQQITEVWIAAIKEKNYPLFLKCIDPARQVTRKGLHLILYHWDWHQHRFANFYCHVVVGKAETYTISGFDAGTDDIKLRFLDPEQIAKIKEHAGEHVQGAELRTVAYDEQGRQYGSPKPRFFKKTGDGQWYITNYPQPF